MGWSKRQIVAEAYAELALAEYDFDTSPEEIQAGVRRLDTMMATWSTQGLQMGYALALSPDAANPDEQSGLPLDSIEAVTLNLAVRISSSKGKAVPATTKAAAKAAFDALVSRIASQQVQEQQLRQGTPAGAGHGPNARPFMPTPNTEQLRNTDDGGLTFTGKNN